MIKKRIKILINKFKKYKIDGYVIPKNDEYFSEYTENDRLRNISNFSGSAGYSIILKNKNYLFVDGRYTIQAEKESENNFQILDYHKIINCNLVKNLSLGLDPKIFTSEQIKKFFNKCKRIQIIDKNLIDENYKKRSSSKKPFFSLDQKIINCNLVKNLTLGIDPKIFTSKQIKKFFNRCKKIEIIDKNLIDEIYKKRSSFKKPFFSLDQKIVGENYKKKISKIKKILNKNETDYLFITAPENVAWLLNIRGSDNPNSPIPNCHLLLDKKNNLFLISKKIKPLN